MMIVPAGEFTMGSPPAEQQAEAQHRVTIATSYAVSKFEITFEDWNAASATAAVITPVETTKVGDADGTP